MSCVVGGQSSWPGVHPVDGVLQSNTPAVLPKVGLWGVWREQLSEGIEIQGSICGQSEVDKGSQNELQIIGYRRQVSSLERVWFQVRQSLTDATALKPLVRLRGSHAVNATFSRVAEDPKCCK